MKATWSCACSNDLLAFKKALLYISFPGLNKYQRVFYTWYEIQVGARFGVRLINWSRRVLLVWNRSLLLAFSDILFSFISTITSKSSALRVSGWDFLEVSVSTFKTAGVPQSLKVRVPQSLKVSNIPFYWPLNKNQWKSNITQACGFDFFDLQYQSISCYWFLLTIIDVFYYWFWLNDIVEYLARVTLSAIGWYQKGPCVNYDYTISSRTNKKPAKRTFWSEVSGYGAGGGGWGGVGRLGVGMPPNIKQTPLISLSWMLRTADSFVAKIHFEDLPTGLSFLIWRQQAF